MKNVFALLAALGAASFVSAQDAAVRQIHERFAAAKPTAAQLAFFSMDWEPDLAAAKARAAREQRPICLVTVHNITSACNFCSGHI